MTLTDALEGTNPTDDYFTCQCNPPVAPMTDDAWPLHRIPIDCMTAEDWQRVAREKQERAVTVWVVTSVGDSDCGGINEGLHGVYSGSVEAWSSAMAVAHQYVDNRDWDDDPEWDVTNEGIDLYRGSVLVTETTVQ